MSFGPNPWQQTNWDARAAGNFIGGGAGCGLIIYSWLAPAQGMMDSVLLLVALALIALGLLCVWAEIGRPWRAINVFINPRTSWMSREAALAPLLLGSGCLVLIGVDEAKPVAALLAAAFLYCQARILQAAKGIPAWREPLTVPLLVVTGLAEGAGLFWLFVPWSGHGTHALWLLFAGLLLLRFGLGIFWYRRLAGQLSARALSPVDRAVSFINAGSLLPLAIALVVLVAPLAPLWSGILQMLAGGLAAFGGAGFKFLLVTRAGFNQGFSLQHLPVRGVRR